MSPQHSARPPHSPRSARRFHRTLTPILIGMSHLVLAAGLATSLTSCGKFDTRNVNTSGSTSDPTLNAAIDPGAAPSGQTNASTATTPTAAATSAPAPALGLTVQTSATASGTPGASAASSTSPSFASQTPAPAPTSTITRRPGKLDPFWIEATAEADRAVWNDAMNLAGLPNDPIATAAITTTPPAASLRDDGAEGLTHVTFAPEGADFDPSVSRDGTFMVFASTQHRATSDIYLKSTTGRTITQLTSDPAHDVMPAISPDGSRIAFATNRNGNWDIYVMSSHGGQAVQITGDTTQELHPSWSPDGKKLVFCRLGAISNRWELWVTDVNNGVSAEFIGFGMFPQWCPKAGTGLDNRDKILFQRSRERGGRSFSIWTVDYRSGDASSPTEIASSQTAAMINAAWSPDGQRIVFATVETGATPSTGLVNNSPSTVPSDLWMSNIDGSGRVNLTSGRFMNLMPTWAKDGRIYFVSDRGGVPNIWSIGTDKAIQAATGVKTTPMTEPKHEMAHVEEGEHTPEAPAAHEPHQ